MKKSNPLYFALGVFVAVALGGTAAYATNGGAVLIGRTNSGTAATLIGNSNGSAAGFYSKVGTPSIAVNRTNKITNLNADMIDNLDSTKLALITAKTGIVTGSGSDADGFINTARCPAGTVATGGGGVAVSDGDYLAYSGPDFSEDTGALITNSWFAYAANGAVAFVTCYNPRGAVPGAVTSFGSVSSMAAHAHGAQKKFSHR